MSCRSSRACRLKIRKSDLAQVVQQVETVCDLHCLRSHAARGVRVFTAAIPTDNLHPWMSEQPGGKLVATAVREHIDDVMPLQIDQNAAIGPAASEREVVHTENTGSRQMRQGDRHAGVPAPYRHRP